MMYSICIGAFRWQIHDFLSDGNSNVCSISRRLLDLHKTRKKCKETDLENEGQGQGVEETGHAIFDWKCSSPYR